jgi:hypothetical protein
MRVLDQLQHRNVFAALLLVFYQNGEIGQQTSSAGCVGLIARYESENV